MHLTKEEEKTLEGDYGGGNKKAMEMLIAIGEANDAQRLISISRAHLSAGGPGALAGETGITYIENLAKQGACCRVPTTTNTMGADIQIWKRMNVPQDFMKQQKRIFEAYKRLGAMLNFDCTPYLNYNIPRFGEHVSFSESNVVAMGNSVFGARTNRESTPGCLAAAIIGKTPEYGYHLEENRRGEVLVKVQAKLRSTFDYSLLGDHLGGQVGTSVPVLIGVPKASVTMPKLKYLSATLNNSGAVALFHIVEVTPEAPTFAKAFGDVSPLERIEVKEEDLKKTCEEMHRVTGKVDLVFFGCPLVTIEEIREIAGLLKGKKVHKGVTFWVNTSLANKVLSKRMGYIDVIEKAGGLVTLACMPNFPLEKMNFDVIVTNSVKFAHYYKDVVGVIASDIEGCVRAAVTGEWHA